VGAFWKHDQIGERVICIKAGDYAPNYGEWRAEVAWMDSRWREDDGVVLAPGGSRGTTVGTANVSAYDANAENFPVTGGSDIVSGTLDAANREIVFRIGLRSTYKPTTEFPARYAVVMLYYGQNRRQKIFLRQGEYDDYLMTPSDPVTAAPTPLRPLAKKYSPYNLTASMLDAAVDVSGTFPAVNPGRFTDYPTQGGAYFQWAESGTNPDRQRWAWPASGTVSDWGRTPSTSYWNLLSATHETCPPGYRRPNDGSISTAEGGNYLTSENRQSIWYRPPVTFGLDKASSAWGYYADGFFDRRLITASNTGEAATAVEATGNEAAYVGCLFFNLEAASNHYNASLFFPASGWRDENGLITGTGRSGHYWMSSALNTITAMVMWIRYDRYSTPAYAEKRHGRTIRCLRTTP
jgi:hypothetical protein